MNTYTGTTYKSERGDWYWVILQNGEIHSSGGSYSAEWEAYEALCKELTTLETNTLTFINNTPPYLDV